MWWRPCSLSHPLLYMTPAGSSEREFQKPRVDKVRQWLMNLIYMMENYTYKHLHALVFSVFSFRLWLVPVWWGSQERNLAWIWKNPGLLHATKWSKIESYGLGWRPVSVTYPFLKWFILSSGSWNIYASLLAGIKCILQLREIIRSCWYHLDSSPIFAGYFGV